MDGDNWRCIGDVLADVMRALNERQAGARGGETLDRLPTRTRGEEPPAGCEWGEKCRRPQPPASSDREVVTKRQKPLNWSGSTYAAHMGHALPTGRCGPAAIAPREVSPPRAAGQHLFAGTVH